MYIKNRNIVWTFPTLLRFIHNTAGNTAFYFYVYISLEVYTNFRILPHSIPWQKLLSNI